MPDTVDLTLNNNRFEVSSFLEKAAKVADSVAKLQNRIEELKVFAGKAHSEVDELSKEKEKNEKKLQSSSTLILSLLLGIVGYIGSCFFGIGFIIPMIIVAMIQKIIKLPTGATLLLSMVLCIVCAIVIGGGIGFLIGYSKISKMKIRNNFIEMELLPKAKLKLSEITKEGNQRVDELKKIVVENEWMILSIPQDYFYVDALSFMSEMLTKGRATNFKEAMNLYEEQLHRWKMEEEAVKTRIASEQGAMAAADAAVSARATRRNTGITAGIEVYRLLSGR